MRIPCLSVNLFLLQVCVGFAQASLEHFQLKETAPTPQNWIKVGRPAATHPITLRIAFPQPGFSLLEQHIYEVSDPAHARYGMHLSKGDVETLISPHSDSLKAVNQWLGEHGLGEEHLRRSSAADWVKFTVPVAKAEIMLNTVSQMVLFLRSP